MIASTSFSGVLVFALILCAVLSTPNGLLRDIWRWIMPRMRAHNTVEVSNGSPEQSFVPLPLDCPAVDPVRTSRSSSGTDSAIQYKEVPGNPEPAGTQPVLDSALRAGVHTGHPTARVDWLSMADPLLYPFPLGNVIWAPRDIAALLCQPGFMSPNDWRPATGVAVVLGESGGDPLATGRAVWNPTSPTHLSIDLGLFQLNSYYHTVTGPYPTVPPITVAQTFDPKEAWQQAWKVLNTARPDSYHYNWKPWTVYNTGAYDAHLERGRQALIDYRAWLAT